MGFSCGLLGRCKLLISKLDKVLSTDRYRATKDIDIARDNLGLGTDIC
jgi:hypothetical protein